VDDKKKLDDDVQNEPKRGSGSLLAAARKEQDKTVEDIANELNLSATQIRTIELDQSEGLPEPTYVRGYIRSYAGLLGLDVEEVLDHYLNPNWQKGSRLDDMPRGIGSASESESRNFLTTGKVFLLIVVAAFIAYLWLSGSFDEFLGGDARPVVQSVETNAGDSDDNSQANFASSQEGSGVNEASVTIPNTSATEVSNVDSDSSENELSLSFTDTTWVDIRDGDGNRLAYKNYVRGDNLTVKAPGSMSVFLGNAKTVTASFNGAPYTISKDQEGVFARFVVGE
jgi:cytoskeleton protein RodZ